jgi:IS30 family transposase
MQTSDRGKEFACFREIEAMGIPFYFAEAYSS